MLSYHTLANSPIVNAVGLLKDKQDHMILYGFSVLNCERVLSVCEMNMKKIVIRCYTD